MKWINEIEFSKSIADLMTSNSLTRAMLQIETEVLDKNASDSKKMTNGDSKEDSSFKEKLQKMKNTFTREGRSHG